MITNEERVRVANELRSLSKTVEPWYDIEGLIEGLDETLFKFGPNSLTDILNRLACLIDPEG